MCKFACRNRSVFERNACRITRANYASSRNHVLEGFGDLRRVRWREFSWLPEEIQSHVAISPRLSLTRDSSCAFWLLVSAAERNRKKEKRGRSTGPPRLSSPSLSFGIFLSLETTARRDEMIRYVETSAKIWAWVTFKSQHRNVGVLEFADRRLKPDRSESRD